jgi:hypothetical protein
MGSDEEFKEFTDMLRSTERNIKPTTRERILITIAPNTNYNKLLSGNKRFDFPFILWLVAPQNLLYISIPLWPEPWEVIIRDRRIYLLD